MRIEFWFHLVPTYKEGNLSTIEDQNVRQKDYDKLYGYSDHCRVNRYDYKKRFFKAEFRKVKE